MQWTKLLKTCSSVKPWTVGIGVILTCYFLLPFLTLLQSYKNNFISSPGHKAYHTVFSPNLKRKAFIWQVCIAALSAAVRGEDWHVIDVTALQFPLPSLPVMRGVFFFPRQFHSSPWCTGSVGDWLSPFCEQGNWDQFKRMAVTNPQCLSVGRLALWVLALQLRHSTQIFGQGKDSSAPLGERFQFSSLQWRVWN